MSSYDNLVVGRIANCNLTDEDFDQIDPNDLEAIDIQWNMEMLTRRGKRFMQRTGRSGIGGNYRTGLGFDKSKVKCFDCHNYGHFARECEKRKQPASGFTRPSSPRGFNQNNPRPFNQHYHIQDKEKSSSQPHTPKALISTSENEYD